MSNNSIRAVTVYCSSSDQVAAVFREAAVETGRLLATEGWSLVYGGNSAGMMKDVADGAHGARGTVIGVTPQLFVDAAVHDERGQLIVTPDMRSRKAEMERLADAFIALPGGLGTFEELFEAWTGRQLNYHNKPIVVVNTDGFFQPLLDLMSHGLEMKFIRPRAADLVKFVATPAEAIGYLREWQPTAPGSLVDLTFEARK
jgi:uncharacterized protein (TIGR00730 family)